MDAQPLPDFELANSFGEIVTAKSFICSFSNLLFISINNKIIIYDSTTKQKVFEIVDNRRFEISTFAVEFRDESIFIPIGFENGIIKFYQITDLNIKYNEKILENAKTKNKASIMCTTHSFQDEQKETKNQTENLNISYAYQSDLIFDFSEATYKIITQFRPHSKAIINICILGDYIYSASLDSSSILYDFDQEDIFISYKGNTAKIFSSIVYENRIYSACSDKTLKIWDVQNENLLNIYAFRSEIADFGVFCDFCIVFLDDGFSEIISLKDGSRKPFNTFKKLRYAKIFHDSLYILTKDKLYSYTLKLLENEKIKKVTNERNMLDVAQTDISFVTEMDIISKGLSLSIKDVFACKLEEDYIDMFENDKSLVLQSKNNKIDIFNVKTQSTSKFIHFHSNEILKIMFIDGFLASISKSEAIVWIFDEILTKSHTIIFDETIHCADQLGNRLVVASKENITFYEIKTGLDLEKIDIKTKCFTSYENHLAIETNENISIFELEFLNTDKDRDRNIENIKLDQKHLNINDKDSQINFSSENSETQISFNSNLTSTSQENQKLLDNKTNKSSQNLTKMKLIKEITIGESISCLKISQSFRYLAIGILSNNNIYLYDLKTGDLKLKLFGHSLPVKHISFNNNENIIISCGADKLVKMWGLDFGECRKSFIGNTQCASFINNNAFIYADQSIKYYNKHNLVKTIKSKYLKYCKFFNDFIVASSKFGIYLFKMQKYELIQEDDESSEIEMEILTKQKIVDTGKYEQFCNAIDDIENKNTCYDTLESILLSIDLSELDRYCFFLALIHLKIVLKAAYNLRNLAIVVSARIFDSILKFHGALVENDTEIYSWWKEIVKNMFEHKNNIGTEHAYFEYIKKHTDQ